MLLPKQLKPGTKPNIDKFAISDVGKFKKIVKNVRTIKISMKSRSTKRQNAEIVREKSAKDFVDKWKECPLNELVN